MFAAPLFLALVGVLQQAGGPPGEKSKTDNGITLQYTDLSDADADTIVATIRLAREMLNKAYTDIRIDPIVRLHMVPGARRIYWTEGEDRVFFDFPNNKFYLNAQVGEDRILRFALPALTQLWLSRSVTSSAGLDPRILDSLVEYAEYHFKAVVAPTKPPPAPPTGPGQVWALLDQVYPGYPGYVLNLLTTQKLPGHLVGDFLRRSAVEVTSDSAVGRLFDAITPPEPLLAAKDVEPGPPLNPETPLRRSRVTLFNGVPLLDTVGEPVAANDRLADFENVFEVATSIEPGVVVADPPTVSGQDVAKLYFEFRSRVLRARDNVDFLLTLREFFGRFRDRSLGVGTSDLPKVPKPPGQPFWFNVFGIGIAQSDGRFYVRKITPGTAPEAAGIKLGMELLTIDGRPAARTMQLLVDVLQTFDSVPSEQRARIDALSLLLSGADASEAELVFAAQKPEAPEPATWSVKLKRGLRPTKAPEPVVVESTLRPDGIGVVTVHQFPNDALKLFTSALEELGKGGAKGIVIDLRGNEGQHDLRNKSAPIAKAALERIMPKEMPPTAIAAEYYRARDSFLPKPLVQIVLQAPPSGPAYAGPIAVLIDAWTGGEAELFAMGIQATKRGTLLGTRSAGSVTLPKDFEDFQALKRTRVNISLPGRALVRPGGEPVQGVGVAPNTEVVPTREDLTQGRDAVLERAVALLKR